MYTIEIDGRVFTEKAFLVVCCNASQYGNNAFIAPEASIRDGLLDLTVVHAGNALTRAFVGVDMLTGFIGRNALIETFRVRSAVIRRSEPGPAHIDGDPVELTDDIAIACHPGRLRIFATTRKTRCVPLLTPVSMFLRDAAITAARLISPHHS